MNNITYLVLIVLVLILGVAFFSRQLRNSLNSMRAGTGSGSQERAKSDLGMRSMSTTPMLRLNAPGASPSLYIEAQIVTTNVLTARAKHDELTTYLADLLSKQNCAGSYQLLMDDFNKIVLHAQSLPATHAHTDIVELAVRARERLYQCLLSIYNPKLMPFGVRIGLMTKCAVDTQPPLFTSTTTV